MRIRTLGFLLGIFCLLAPARSSWAFNCTLNATGLNFGSYDVFAATPRDATGSVTVDCNIPPQNPFAPLMVTVSLSPGNSGSFAQRRMQGPGAILNYNLYTKPSFSSVWGDGSGVSEVQSNFVSRGNPWTATIYGRIPARQNVPAGSYSDLLTVTVEW